MCDARYNRLYHAIPARRAIVTRCHAIVGGLGYNYTVSKSVVWLKGEVES